MVANILCWVQWHPLLSICPSCIMKNPSTFLVGARCVSHSYCMYSLRSPLHFWSLSEHYMKGKTIGIRGNISPSQQSLFSYNDSLQTYPSKIHAWKTCVICELYFLHFLPLTHVSGLYRYPSLLQLLVKLNVIFKYRSKQGCIYFIHINLTVCSMYFLVKNVLYHVSSFVL